jgi:hypothetical protein
MADLKPFTPALEVMAAMRVASVFLTLSMVSWGTVFLLLSPSGNSLQDFSHMHQPMSALTQSMGGLRACMTIIAASITSKPESSPGM